MQPGDLPINFRDFGGVRTATGALVKPGILYRSGAPATPEAMDALRAGGIRTLIDLRSRQERRRALHPWPGAVLESLPLDFDRVVQRRLIFAVFKRHPETAVHDIVEGVYRDAVDRAHPQIAGLFRILSDPGAYPVLIFCRAGRDRTGYVVAVLQLALGVELEDVVAEYLRSNAYLLPQARHAVAALERFSWGRRPARSLHAAFTSQERYIRSVTGKIEGEYGGIAGYLKACGVGEETLKALQGNLIQA